MFSCQHSVASYLSAWLDLRTFELAASTLSSYRTVARLYVVPLIGSLDLQAVSPLEVRRVVSAAVASGHTRQAQLSLVLMRVAFRDAVSFGFMSSNPAADVSPPKHHKQPIRFWSTTVIRHFLMAQRFSPLYHAWLLALLCGLRRGELLGLRWSDIDGDRIRICNQRILIDHVVLEKPPKSVSSLRSIPIPPVVVAALNREKARSQSIYVLSHADGTPYSAKQLKSALDAACASSGVPRIHLHGLRHSMATAALESGVDVKVLQSLLGHAHYSVTADIYLHPSDAIRADAVASLASNVL